MRDDMRAGIAGTAGFGFALVFSIAGALLIAPWVSLLAMAALPVDRQFWRVERFPWALLFSGLFLAWVAISFLWSPHDDPGQIWRTCLGIPLYALFAARIGKLEGRWQRRVEAAIFFLMISLGLFLVYEALFDGVNTLAFKLAEEDFSGMSPQEVSIFVNRNLGHAAVPLILLAVPAALMAWREGGILIGVVFVVMAAIAAFSYETQVNAAAFILAAIAAGLAAFWPRTMITVTFGITAGMLVVMPLALPELIANLPEGVRDALPLSWIWRLEIWSYAGELIRENPWFGYGLDASRPLNRELLLQGFNVEALPMHPHNATLHIWLETGAVGAVLLASALVAMGGRIAAAPKLSRLQAIGVVWVFVVYVSLIVFSYGVWQEWHQGTVALAATSVFFLGAKRPA
ncbi:O-antigen ligase family protein [Maricaulis parjimensis]|uniref:O-antigen ligase family protein n=1 Tax=Maricaulis parjimensis TaxID=144023 RepID=UPI00193A6635